MLNITFFNKYGRLTATLQRLSIIWIDSSSDSYELNISDPTNDGKCGVEGKRRLYAFFI